MTKQTKGKIASIIIVLFISVPVIYTFADFYWTGVRGVRDDTRKTSTLDLNNPFANIKIANPLDSLVATTPMNTNKNQDLLLLNDDGTTNGKNEKAKDTPELGGGQLIPNANPPFKNKIYVKKQTPEAVGNNFLHLKNSYDVTINKATTTVFISAIDPRLSEDRSISINYELARRLGLEQKDGVYEAVSVRKK